MNQMYERAIYSVYCKACASIHTTQEVKLLNVEENQHGEDIATFSCPVTGLTMTSLVRLA